MFCSRFVSYDKMMEKWCIPFLGADPSVVRRSQRHSVEVRDKKPVQYGAYVVMPSLLAIMLLLFFGFFFALLCQFNKGRKLLEKVNLTCCSLQLQLTRKPKSLDSIPASFTGIPLLILATKCPSDVLQLVIGQW